MTKPKKHKTMRKLSFVVALVAMTLVYTSASAQKQITPTIDVTQQELIEIPVHELPNAIIAVVTADFTEHSKTHAFKTLKDNKEVHLVVYTKNSVQEEVVFNKEGKILSKKDTAL